MSVPKREAVIIGGDFLGLGIARNLRGLGIRIILVDPGFCITRYSKCVDAFYKCPPLAKTDDFMDFLVRLAESECMDKAVLFPSSDTSVRILSQYRNKLDQYFLVPTPPWHITKLSYNKRLTYELTLAEGIPVPATFFPKNEEDLFMLPLEFPVILKPAITANFFYSEGLKAIPAKDRNELLNCYRHMASIIDKSEIMVQQLIGGGTRNLYSFCSLFRDGEVKAKIMAKRLRQYPMDFGIATTLAVTCDIPVLEEFAVRMLRGMNYYGLSEIEFMYDERDGTYKLLDINARSWAWHTLGARSGQLLIAAVQRYA